jgi:hypothetical protein
MERTVQAVSFGALANTVVGVVTVLVFSAFTLFSYLDGQTGASAGLFLFACLGLYVLSTGGRYTIDQNEITHLSILGRSRISWNDIRRLRTTLDGRIVVVSHRRKFLLPHPDVWSGKQKQEARELFASLARHHGL